MSVSFRHSSSPAQINADAGATAAPLDGGAAFLNEADCIRDDLSIDRQKLLSLALHRATIAFPLVKRLGDPRDLHHLVNDEAHVIESTVRDMIDCRRERQKVLALPEAEQVRRQEQWKQERAEHGLAMPRRTR